MGNSSGKEQGSGRNGQRRSATDPVGGVAPATESSSLSSPPGQVVYSSRAGRGSRPDLSTLLSIASGNTTERDVGSLETRRETKQEREIRKAEKERVAREKERERSMREEHVDGGYLVTQGVYTGTEDYNKGVVRQLMIERRIAPFWRGLNDHDHTWTENQLVAVARGRPLPMPDAIPENEPKEPVEAETNQTPPIQIQTNMDSLTVPITSRTHSFNSDNSSNASPLSANFPTLGTSAPATSSIGSALSRGRAKTIASLTGTSKSSQIEMTPKEVNLPRDECVNGQKVEAVLYKDAAECPICFLYYPPFLNRTRCCDQAICSECFVQIKRPDPHPPGHVDPSAPVPPSNPGDEGPNDELVSEPADCPYCQAPEFGVTYEPPSFRRGLAYANQMHPLNNATSAMSSTTSVASGQSNLVPGSTRRRTISVSANDPIVITTDRVRPDWHQKLAAARAHTARRSAAATALHTAAYLMGNRGYEADGRSFGSFGRRGILRRTSGPDHSGSSNASQMSMLALMSERYAAHNAARGETEGEPPVNPPPRGSSRRGRAEDLEDMMMMEAIRLSLASEEERRKREEKESKKDAKRKDKDNKKAEKAAKKSGSLTATPNESSLGLGTGHEEFSFGESSSSLGKGKEVQQDSQDELSGTNPQVHTTPQTHLERARQQILPNDSSTPANLYSSTPRKPSHLRTLSNASSSSSSIESLPASSHQERTLREQSSQADGTDIPGAPGAQGNHLSGTPPTGTADLEPLFNFNSLAAMVGDEKRETEHHGGAANLQAPGHQRGESSTSLHSNDLYGLQDSIAMLKTDHDSSSASSDLTRPSEGLGSVPKAN